MRNVLNKISTVGALAIGAFLLASSTANASGVVLNSLTQTDLDNVNKEMSHNFMFSSVSGASSLGSIWGFEVGVVGGMSNADHLNEIIKRTSPNSDFKNLYDAAVMARVSIPAGFTLEASLLPKVDFQGAKVSQMGAAARYTIIELPVAVGVRAHYSKSNFSFTQTQGAFTGNVDYDNSVYGLQAVVSQNFLLIEPYAAVGWVHGKSDLAATGTGSIGQTGDAKASSMDLTVGANLHLAFFNLGAEYSRAFGTNRYLGKLTFGF